MDLRCKSVTKRAFWCIFDQKRMTKRYVIKVWRHQYCFYWCRRFEYLMRFYDVIKPWFLKSLNVFNFFGFYLILIKFTSKCMIWQNRSHKMHSLPTVLFPFKDDGKTEYESCCIILDGILLQWLMSFPVYSKMLCMHSRWILLLDISA